MQIGKDYPRAAKVFRFFEEISKIPRRSFVTAPIADYLTDFAKARGLFCLRDAADNVIIKKPASHGAAHTPTVILQAHTDMVYVTEGQSTEESDKGVILCEEGDFLSAKGTSLGGDDGIGMAYILAILDDTALTHPPIEAVFTSNEEVGLLGATALDTSALSGQMLINLDSDEEGIFTAGCAGGSDTTLTLPIKPQEALPCYTLKVCGLPGGHSGIKISDGIPNAILLALSILSKLSESHPVNLSSIDGGEAFNAIPTFASIQFHTDALLDEICAFCKEEFSNLTKSETNGQCMIEKCEAPSPCISEEESYAIIQKILALPNGVMAMEKHIEGLPETSLNLGIIKTADGCMTLTYALRSSIDTKRKALEETVTYL